VRGNLGVNPGPNPTAPLKPVVLNRRLAYISQIVDAGNPVPAVTILDTSDLTNVTVQESIPIPAGDNVVGLVGRRGTELNPSAVGGSISVMVGRACAGDPPVCDLVALPITIGNDVSELAANDFGPFQGIPAFASTPVLPDSVTRPFSDVIDSLGAYALTFDPVAGDPRWWQFDPADPASKASPSSLPASTSTTFNGFAVSECLAAGVTADASVEKLTGVHLANGEVLDLSPPLADIVTDVVIEPFQGNALTLRSPGADFPAVRAFQIETIGSGASQQVSLAERSVWNAPSDVDPISIAVRQTEAPECE
jgi:hypothetical protein